MDSLSTFPAAQPYGLNADAYDVKTIDGEVTLRQFIAAFISYSPDWMHFLYDVRGVFVRFLGMRQNPRDAASRHVSPLDDLFHGKVWIFDVEAGRENEFWVGCGSDKHLKAYLVIDRQPLDGKTARFRVGTFVFYRHWTGRVYFNVIRPFHHLVVAATMRAAVQSR